MPAVLSIPCPQVIRGCDCTNDPISNYSSEAPDHEVFYGQVTQPPTVGTWFAPACFGVCESLVSQELADECAARNAFECSLDGAPRTGNPVPRGTFPPLRFRSTVQECSADCGDGNTTTVVEPAGTVVSATQADADARAHGLACKRAKELMVCFVTASPLTAINEGAFADIPIVATGGNGDYEFTLTSGTLPPGMTLDAVGLLSGTPTASATYTFAITVADTGGATATKTFTLQVIGTTPAAWWKLDGSATDPVDEVGSYVLAFSFNHRGTPGVAGKIAQAFSFDAINNQSVAYQTADIPALAYTGAGVECLFWLRFDAVASPGAGICQFTCGPGFFNGADFYSLILLYDDDTNPNVLTLKLNFNNVQTAIVATAHVPVIGAWRFIRMRFDAATGKIGLAIDNSALNESAPSAIAPGNTGHIFVGSFAQAGSSMAVSLDEFGLFLTNLTTAEATSIYNGGLGETCCPLAP